MIEVKTSSTSRPALPAGTVFMPSAESHTSLMLMWLVFPDKGHSTISCLSYCFAHLSSQEGPEHAGHCERELPVLRCRLNSMVIICNTLRHYHAEKYTGFESFRSGYSNTGSRDMTSAVKDNDSILTFFERVLCCIELTAEPFECRARWLFLSLFHKNKHKASSHRSVMCQRPWVFSLEIWYGLPCGFRFASFIFYLEFSLDLPVKIKIVTIFSFQLKICSKI